MKMDLNQAVGEPPLFLASSVLFAIREAIKEARKDAGITPSFTLDAPATAGKIRIACQDHITAKVPTILFHFNITFISVCSLILAGRTTTWNLYPVEYNSLEIVQS